MFAWEPEKAGDIDTAMTHRIIECPKLEMLASNDPFGCVYPLLKIAIFCSGISPGCQIETRHQKNPTTQRRKKHPLGLLCC